jgi:hypothetical protein
MVAVFIEAEAMGIEPDPVFMEAVIMLDDAMGRVCVISWVTTATDPEIVCVDKTVWVTKEVIRPELIALTGMLAEGIETEDIPAEGLLADDIPAEGMLAEDIPAQGMFTGDIPAEGMLTNEQAGGAAEDPAPGALIIEVAGGPAAPEVVGGSRVRAPSLTTQDLPSG